MTARVFTSGKVSKAKRRSVAAVVIEGLPEGPLSLILTANRIDDSPTVAQARAAALGLGVALQKGATDVELVTPSKRVAKALLSEPGGAIDDYHGALTAGWAIYWREALAGALTVEVAKADPRVEGLLAAAVALPDVDALSLF